MSKFKSRLGPPWVTAPHSRPRLLTPLAEEILDECHTSLMIDDEWVVRRPNGFTWWSHKHAQHIWIDQPHMVHGDPAYSLRVETDVLSEVEATPDEVLETTGVINAASPLYALIFDPERRSVCFRSSAYIHEGNRSVLRVLVTAALLQNIEAHRGAAALAGMLQGRPATSVHPTNGGRVIPDDLLNYVHAKVIPAGSGASPYAGENLEQLAKPGRYIPWVLAHGNSESLTGELEFRGSVPAALTAPALPQTSLVQVSTTTQHELLGSGAMLTLVPPLALASQDAVALAHALNLTEAVEDVPAPLLGAWRPLWRGDGSADGVVFEMFLPAVLYDPGLLSVALYYFVERNTWLRAHC